MIRQPNTESRGAELHVCGLHEDLESLQTKLSKLPL